MRPALAGRCARRRVSTYTCLRCYTLSPRPHIQTTGSACSGPTSRARRRSPGWSRPPASPSCRSQSSSGSSSWGEEEQRVRTGGGEAWGAPFEPSVPEALVAGVDVPREHVGVRDVARLAEAHHRPRLVLKLRRVPRARRVPVVRRQVVRHLRRVLVRRLVRACAARGEQRWAMGGRRARARNFLEWPTMRARVVAAAHSFRRSAAPRAAPSSPGGRSRPSRRCACSSPWTSRSCCWRSARGRSSSASRRRRVRAWRRRRGARGEASHK